MYRNVQRNWGEEEKNYVLLSSAWVSVAHMRSRSVMFMNDEWIMNVRIITHLETDFKALIILIIALCIVRRTHANTGKVIKSIKVSKLDSIMLINH